MGRDGRRPHGSQPKPRQLEHHLPGSNPALNRVRSGDDSRRRVVYYARRAESWLEILFILVVLVGNSCRPRLRSARLVAVANPLPTASSETIQPQQFDK